MRCVAKYMLVAAFLFILGGCATTNSPAPGATSSAGAAGKAFVRSYDVRDILNHGDDREQTTEDLLTEVRIFVSDAAELSELNSTLIIKAHATDHLRVAAYTSGRRVQIMHEIDAPRSARLMSVLKPIKGPPASCQCLDAAKHNRSATNDDEPAADDKPHAH